MQTVSSRDVRVMNLKKSSHPEETETFSTVDLVSSSVAVLMSARMPAMVPAVLDCVTCNADTTMKQRVLLIWGKH